MIKKGLSLALSISLLLAQGAAAQGNLSRSPGVRNVGRAALPINGNSLGQAGRASQPAIGALQLPAPIPVVNAPAPAAQPQEIPAAGIVHDLGKGVKDIVSPSDPADVPQASKEFFDAGKALRKDAGDIRGGVPQGRAAGLNPRAKISLARRSFIGLLAASLLNLNPLTSRASINASALDSNSPKQVWQEKRAQYDKVDSVTTYPTEKVEPFAAQVKVVADPQEGFLAKIMMIRGARRTIDVSTYIFSRDAVGYAILGELKKAVERGVSVRLMVDSLGSFNLTHSEMKALLDAKPGYVKDASGRPTKQRAAVEVVIFNSVMNPPIIYQMLRRNVRNFFKHDDHNIGDVIRWRNRRSHDKILLIDQDDENRAIAMMGGRNIAEHYYGLPKVTPSTYNDMEVIVRNDPSKPRAQSLKTTLGAHYDRLYFHLGNKVLKRNLFAFTDKGQAKKMRGGLRATLYDNPEAMPKFKRMKAQRYLERDFSETSADFVNEIENISRHNAFFDPENPVNRPNGNSIVANFHKHVMAAKKSVVFVSPYLVMEDDEIETLQKWLDADPARTLTIVSNSIMTTDNLPAQAEVDSILARKFLENPKWSNARGQVKIYAFGRLDGQALGGKAFYGKLHAKYAVVDGRVGLVSTSNADYRSRTLNSEIGFILEGGRPAEELKAAADAIVARSYLWGSPEWGALRKKYPVKIAVEKFLMWWFKYFHVSQRMV